MIIGMISLAQCGNGRVQPGLQSRLCNLNCAEPVVLQANAFRSRERADKIACGLKSDFDGAPFGRGVRFHSSARAFPLTHAGQTTASCRSREITGDGNSIGRQIGMQGYRGPKGSPYLFPSHFSRSCEELCLETGLAFPGQKIGLHTTVAAGAVEPPPTLISCRDGTAGDLADKFLKRVTPGVAIEADRRKIDGH